MKHDKDSNSVRCKWLQIN